MITPVVVMQNAMADFIKCVDTFSSGSTTYIATAGSDKSIMLFDATPLTSHPVTSSTTLRCLHQAKPHTRPINTLTSLTGFDGITRLYSGDSMGRLLESTIVDSRLTVQREIKGFGTAVYDLVAGFSRVEVEASDASHADAFTSPVHDDDDGTRYQLVGQLYGASGDKSVKGFKLSSPSRPFVTLAHTDYVKAVIPLAFHLPSSTAVVTGGSDEHLRLFSHPLLLHVVRIHRRSPLARNHLSRLLASPTYTVSDVRPATIAPDASLDRLGQPGRLDSKV